MGRRYATLFARSTIFLLAVLAGGQMTVIVNAQALTTVTSGWMTRPIVVDGKITTPDEWSDTVPVYMFFVAREGKPMSDQIRVWIKNDLKDLCVLASVPWPVDSVDGSDYFAMSITLGLKTDSWNMHANSRAYDSLTDETGQYAIDDQRIPPGTIDVEGRASYDGIFYWFEFRRKLNTGDPYDIVLVPGQRYNRFDFQFVDYVPRTRHERTVVLELAPVLPSIRDASPKNNAFLNVSQVNFTASVSGHLRRVTLVVGEEYEMKLSNKTGLYEASLTLADGKHRWRVDMYGILGNLTRMSDRDLTVDTIRPTVTILAPRSGEVTEKSTVSWESSDLGSGIAKLEVRIDALDWVNVTGRSSYVAVELATGSHEVRVRAIDKAGNVAEKVVTFTFLPPPWYVTYWYVPVILVAVIVVIAAVTISRRGPPKLSTKPPEVKPLKIERPPKPPTREELLKELEELYRSGRIKETAYRRLKKKYETQEN